MLVAKKIKILPLIIFIGLSGILSSCSQKKNTGFDGKEYDISFNQDNSLIADLAKVSGGYKIILSGNSESKDFSLEDKVPWYPILPKIKEVEMLITFRFIIFLKIYLQKMEKLLASC